MFLPAELPFQSSFYPLPNWFNVLPVKNAGKWTTKIKHLSHPKIFFLGSNSLLPLPRPTPLRGGKAPGTVLSHYQLHPAAPSSTHFSPVPEWDPSQEPQSSRINLLPEGLQFLQEIPTCPSAGPVKTSVDPYSGLVPSKGCRTVPAPSLPRAAGESLLWCLQCFLPFSSDLAAHRVFPTPLCSILPLETQACSFTTARPRDTHLPAPWATFPAAWETQAILLLWSSAGRKVKTRSLCTQGHLPAAIKLHPDVGEDPTVGEDLTVRNSNWVASTGLWGFTLWDPRAQTLGGAAEARGLL